MFVCSGRTVWPRRFQTPNRPRLPAQRQPKRGRCGLRGSSCGVTCICLHVRAYVFATIRARHPRLSRGHRRIRGESEPGLGGLGRHGASRPDHDASRSVTTAKRNFLKTLGKTTKIISPPPGMLEEAHNARDARAARWLRRRTHCRLVCCYSRLGFTGTRRNVIGVRETRYYRCPSQ